MVPRPITSALLAATASAAHALRCPRDSGPHFTKALSTCIPVQRTVIALSRTTGNRPPIWGLYVTLPAADWPRHSEQTDHERACSMQQHLAECGYLSNAPFALDLRRTGTLSSHLCRNTAHCDPISYCTLGQARYVLWALTEPRALDWIDDIIVDRPSSWVLADGNHRMACLNQLGCGQAAFYLSDDPAIRLHAMPRWVTAAELHRVPRELRTLTEPERKWETALDSWELDHYLQDLGIPIRTETSELSDWHQLTPHVELSEVQERLEGGQLLPYKAFSTTPKPPAGLVVTSIPHPTPAQTSHRSTVETR